MATVAVVTIFP